MYPTQAGDCVVLLTGCIRHIESEYRLFASDLKDYSD